MKLQVGWTGLWNGLLTHWTAAASRQRQQQESVLRHEIENARREMEAAECYFHTVTEPELVDHAIFTMEAARRKYLYLFRRLRCSRTGQIHLGQGGTEWM